MVRAVAVDPIVDAPPYSGGAVICVALYQYRSASQPDGFLVPGKNLVPKPPREGETSPGSRAGETPPLRSPPPAAHLRPLPRDAAAPGVALSRRDGPPQAAPVLRVHRPTGRRPQHAPVTLRTGGARGVGSVSGVGFTGRPPAVTESLTVLRMRRADLPVLPRCSPATARLWWGCYVEPSREMLPWARIGREFLWGCGVFFDGLS